MAIEHTIPELDRGGLRQFGFTTGAIVAILFGVFFPWLLERPWPLWPWLILGGLGGLGLIVPEALRPVYRTWMKFGLLASRVTTPLILSIVFFLVISPVGLVRRVTGRDPMARAFDGNASSYRVTIKPRPTKSLEKPF